MDIALEFFALLLVLSTAVHYINPVSVQERKRVSRFPLVKIYGIYRAIYLFPNAKYFALMLTYIRKASSFSACRNNMPQEMGEPPANPMTASGNRFSPFLCVCVLSSLQKWTQILILYSFRMCKNIVQSELIHQGQNQAKLQDFKSSLNSGVQGRFISF